MYGVFIVGLPSAVDDTDDSEQALDWAISMLNNGESIFHLLHVVRFVGRSMRLKQEAADSKPALAVAQCICRGQLLLLLCYVCRFLSHRYRTPCHVHINALLMTPMDGSLRA
jgi:hypothetical protein